MHLYWSFRTAKGISVDVAWARYVADLPSKPTGRGVVAAAARALLLSNAALLLSITASGLPSLALREQLAGDLMLEQDPVVFFQTLASLFGVGVLVLWIAVAACFVAFVHQVETATADLPETIEEPESTETD